MNNFSKIEESLLNKTIRIVNERLGKVIQGYSFYYIKNQLDFNQNQQIFQRMIESKIIIIDHYIEENLRTNNLYFIIGFEKTVLIIIQSSISFLYSLFSMYSNLLICFLSNTKEIFDKNVEINYIESKSDTNFVNEISNFNYQLNIKKTKESYGYIKIWNIIKSCISGYLIKCSYLNLNNDRINNFYLNKKKSIEHENIKKNEYVELRDISIGSYCLIKLIYHIEKEKLYAIKSIHSYDDKAFQNQEREMKNYSMLSHPCVPEFYGVIENTNTLIFEFIDGKMLSRINVNQLSKKEKFTMILQLLSVIKYLHENNFVYRDLKPDNIMIDRNNNLVLIDFDRMLKEDNTEDHTRDFSIDFIAPEISLGFLTNKSDIYSIGKIISYFFNKDELNYYNNSDLNLSEKLNINTIINECTANDPVERPPIEDVVISFLSFITDENFILENIDPNDQFDLGYYAMDDNNIEKAIQYLTLSSKHNHCEAQFNLGLIYFETKYNVQDIDKSIHYFSLAVCQNNPFAAIYLGNIYLLNNYFNINKAIYYFNIASDHNISKVQYILGEIYYYGIYIPIDIYKAIHYFTLAANQNDAAAQYLLGLIYCSGKYIAININKAIRYLTLAANQNVSKAQLLLGKIYYTGELVTKDINKSIYYLTLASYQNDDEANAILGLIYYYETDIKKDIDKSIYYFTLASNQNNAMAQFGLGSIYLSDYSVKQDINKSIYYFTLASNQNNKDAQYNLGLLYFHGKNIKIDIEKSIHYFTLASNQNDMKSQFLLGLIYYNGYHVKQDITKSIYYFSLASDQNFAEAHFILSKIYFNGESVKRDIKKSIHYLLLASNQNISNAQYNLGIIYYTNKYVQRDTQKSIYYLTLAAKQDYIDAQNILGFIYYSGEDVPRDIYRSIYYFSLASNHNYAESQFALGCIYFENEYIAQDIQKSIYYFTLASEQNYPAASFYLGIIYYIDETIPRDINKSIHYFTLASNQNHSDAQYLLGIIYYDDQYIKRDIKKSIHYLSLASIQNNSRAQLLLGYIYFKGDFIKQNIEYGIDLMTHSSNNRNIDATLLIACLYHEGKYVKRDIKKSIKLYKEVSSFNNQYAKNNLGIIYKNGFGNEVQKNPAMAEIYFKESISQSDNIVSMYNLSHLYIYEDRADESINKSIDLLVKSSSSGFLRSTELLSLIMVKKYGENYDEIKLEIEKYLENSNDLTVTIINMIKSEKLYDQKYFEKKYQELKAIDFYFNEEKEYKQSQELLNQRLKHNDDKNLQKFIINSDFYEGLGFDI